MKGGITAMSAETFLWKNAASLQSSPEDCILSSLQHFFYSMYTYITLLHCLGDGSFSCAAYRVIQAAWYCENCSKVQNRCWPSWNDVVYLGPVVFFMCGFGNQFCRRSCRILCVCLTVTQKYGKIKFVLEPCCQLTGSKSWALINPTGYGHISVSLWHIWGIRFP